MEQYEIGKVIGVFGEKIEVSLIDFIEEEDICYGVPENMCVSLESKEGPKPLIIGQPGNYVKISLPSGFLLTMISEIRMREKSFSSRELKDAEEAGGYLIENPERILNVIPIGTIDPSGKFERGTDVFPTVNASVYAVTNETIDKIYASYAEGDFTLGKLSLLTNQEAKINFDYFMGRHSAIIGQTGSGKSWAVASILQKIANFQKSSFVLFDLHGEYKNAFQDEKFDYIDASELEFPYWLMNFQELVDLMIDQTEYSAPNQVAMFRELLQEAKESNEENQKLKIPKITIDTPVFFDFEEIIKEFKRFNEQMVQGSRGQKQGPYFGKFDRMLMRLNSRLNDKRYDLIFHPKKYKTSASMEDLFRKLLGEVKESINNGVIIDISPVPMEVRNSVISLVLRCLFDFAYWYKRINSESYPIAIFCDEAHAYLNEDESSMSSARISAERIAKEGRKYGISLSVISQRPREVSATILSQCNTFMCLRIINPNDQIYVKRLLPDSIRGIVSLFTSLRRGECILLGDSVIMPTRIRIDEPVPQPSSEDTSFYEIWNQSHEEIDIDSVLDAWRKQKD